MTEIEETIKSLEEMFPNGLCEVDEYKMSQVAINALEKQIPQKPIEDGYYDEPTVCPNCGCDIIINFVDNYCSFCGQKLDLSDHITEK